MKYTQGVTLVELIITIAIAAILLAVGVLSLRSLYEGTRANSNIERIQNTFHFARNQAISLGRRVKICPSDGDTCTNNWIQGAIVFTDDNGNLKKDGDEVILNRIPAFDDSDHIKSPHSSYTFSATGFLASRAGSLTYCPSKIDHEASQKIRINFNGRIRRDPKRVDCK
ncbi:prepilin-type N-terminal cleavage/methylation domain-containing protein [Parashewanella curva]|uniref:Type II secretion system protein H n=1 Tax=Parashewanella curva TaxID=2338552 RepID=A0A3L8PZV4_9GAMM|nr:GspH/FimT family pseudopilin [Parashewanella curva]RLV59622.1 prepilin-type N-terminal cleavage/methylation domain-containing protein [Parashewanella curva]